MAATISVLASRLGLRADTLRYYERLGLLRPAGRTAAGYRLYNDEEAERLRFIKGAQRMGLRLADIKELLEVRDRGDCPCGHTRLLVQRRLSEVTAEIAQLEAVRRQLLDLKKRNDTCTDASGSQWTCLTTTREGGEPSPYARTVAVTVGAAPAAAAEPDHDVMVTPPGRPAIPPTPQGIGAEEG